MAELIAGLALFISILVFIMNYRNQVVRRHGEITKLRSDLVQRLSVSRRILRSAKLQLETARLELRRLIECDEKYEFIEMMPRLIEKNQLLIQKNDLVLRSLDKINTVGQNKNKILITLQSCEHEVHIIENSSIEFENNLLDLLMHICSLQIGADDKKIEVLDKAQPINSADPKEPDR